MKNVQNEHFQVESLNKKIHPSKIHIWGPTHNLMKNVQNEHFQVESLNKKFHSSKVTFEVQPTIWWKMFKMNTFK